MKTQNKVSLGNINGILHASKLGKEIIQIDDLGEIKIILEEAEKIDEDEDKKYGRENRGDELPENLRSKLSRKIAIEKAYIAFSDN